MRGLLYRSPLFNQSERRKKLDDGVQLMFFDVILLILIWVARSTESDMHLKFHPSTGFFIAFVIVNLIMLVKYVQEL